MTTYKVNDLYPTIQGEGAKTGTAMVLLRLMGCQVGCPFCDTKETWVADPNKRVDDLGQIMTDPDLWGEFEGEAIARYIRLNYPQYNWVLLTGGEPADQNLSDLTTQLVKNGFRIALETSGTSLGHVGSRIDWVCVSPKFDMPGKRQVLPHAVMTADEVKVVVGRQRDLDRFDQYLEALNQDGLSCKSGQVISLQPVSQSPKATELCVTTALVRGWNLSLQTHKYIKIR